MKVSSVSELAEVMRLCNEHSIDRLELEGVVIVRSPFATQGQNLNIIPGYIPMGQPGSQEQVASAADLEELRTWNVREA